MKKQLRAILLVALVLIVLGVGIPACRAIQDWYSDETPWDYPSSIWISEDPYFVLSMDGKSATNCVAGKGERQVRFEVACRGNNVFFLTTDEDGSTVQLAQGRGYYSSKKFTVTFREGCTIPGVYEEPIYRIVFIRQQ